MSNLNQETGSFSQQTTEQSQSGESHHLSAQGSVQMPVKSKRVKKAKGAFRTISEVANKLDVQQHVLRFWETKFSQVRPLKRGGGRRYYRPEDVALLERIHHLLYTEGYTIKGVQKLLKEQGKAQIIASANASGDKVKASASQTKALTKVQAKETASVKEDTQKPQFSTNQRAALEIMLAELKAMRAMIKV